MLNVLHPELFARPYSYVVKSFMQMLKGWHGYYCWNVKWRFGDLVSCVCLVSTNESFGVLYCAVFSIKFHNSPETLNAEYRQQYGIYFRNSYCQEFKFECIMVTHPLWRHPLHLILLFVISFWYDAVISMWQWLRRLDFIWGPSGGILLTLWRVLSLSATSWTHSLPIIDEKVLLLHTHWRSDTRTIYSMKTAKRVWQDYQNQGRLLSS